MTHAFAGRTFIVPTEQETRELTGCSTFMEAGPRLVSEYQSDVLVTRGKRNDDFLPKNGGHHFHSPNPMNEFDVTGAGDTILAILGLAYAVGMPLHEAATLANRGRGLWCKSPGTATVSLEELISSVEDNRHIRR